MSLKIKPSKYAPKQFNGPVISAFMEAMDAEFRESDRIADYLYKLSIETANETELENIGLLVGYPRPLVPEGFNEENVLLLGGLPLETDPLIGLADYSTEIGGTLSSTETNPTGYMSLGLYRKFLDKMATLKRYGITLYSVCKVCSAVSDNFTVSFDDNKDIVVKYNEPIGYKNIWSLTQIFYRMATCPQVSVITTL